MIHKQLSCDTTIQPSNEPEVKDCVRFISDYNSSKKARATTKAFTLQTQKKGVSSKCVSTEPTMASNVELMVFTIASIAIQCLAMNVTVLRSEQDRFQTLPRNCSLCFAYKGVCTARHLPCQCPKERPTFVVNRKACISAATLTKGKNRLYL